MMRIALAVAIAAVGCGDKKRESAPSGDPGERPAEVDDPSIKPTGLPAGLPIPEAAAKTPDAVYLATAEALLAIEDGGFVKEADLPDFFSPVDIAVDAGGAVWVLGRESVAKLEGASFATIKLSDGNGALKQLAVRDGDNIDVVGVYGISHFDGTGWTLARSDDLLGAKSGGIQGLAMDGGGRGYATAYNVLLVREQKIWKALDRDENLYSAIDITRDGQLAIAMSDGVLLAEAGGARRIAVDGCFSPDELAVFPDKILLHCHDAIIAVDRKSTATRVTRLDKGVGLVHAVDFDAAGRAYIGSREGFFVVDGGELRSFKLGSVPQMASGVRAVHASGGGAAALPAEAEVRYGAIEGTLRKAGKPLAGVAIELCTNTSSLIKPGETPCSNANWKASGRTGPGGDFGFDEVPVGALEFAYLPRGDDKWVLVMGFRCCADLKPGGKLTVGPIDML